MLEVDADRRITAEQALAHQYLSQYADPTDEPSSAPYDQTFEDLDLPVDQWKGDLTSFFFHLKKKSILKKNLISVSAQKIFSRQIDLNFTPPVWILKLVSLYIFLKT